MASHPSQNPGPICSGVMRSRSTGLSTTAIRHPAFRHRDRDEHAGGGFPRYLVGRPLFPLQLVDGAVSLAAVATAQGGGARPARWAATYLLVYGAAQFVAKSFRGDPQAAFRRLSEAQWMASLLAAQSRINVIKLLQLLPQRTATKPDASEDAL